MHLVFYLFFHFHRRMDVLLQTDDELQQALLVDLHCLSNYLYIGSIQYFLPISMKYG